MILGIQIEHIGLDEEDYATKIIEEFDVNGDNQISEEEFIKGLSKWLVSDKDSHKFTSRIKQNLFNTNPEVHDKFRSFVFV